jgi:hypothetical protein
MMPQRWAQLLGAVAAATAIASASIVVDAASAARGAASTVDLVWPQPATVRLPASGTPEVPLAAGFRILHEPVGADVDSLLANAAQRYEARILADLSDPPTGSAAAAVADDNDSLATLLVTVSSPNATLTLGVDESYTLTISAAPANGIHGLPKPPAEAASPSALLQANSVWGALRGLETFAQLARSGFASRPSSSTVTAAASAAASSADAKRRSPSSAGAAPSSPPAVPAVTVRDEPRFAYRGVLVDLARHFINTTRLRLVVDSLELHKLNVLLLHLTDDQSFPFESSTHPNITAMGAFNSESVYSHQDVRDLTTCVITLSTRLYTCEGERPRPGSTAWATARATTTAAAMTTRLVSPPPNIALLPAWETLRVAARNDVVCSLLLAQAGDFLSICVCVHVCAACVRVRVRVRVRMHVRVCTCVCVFGVRHHPPGTLGSAA